MGRGRGGILKAGEEQKSGRDLSERHESNNEVMRVASLVAGKEGIKATS